MPRPETIVAAEFEGFFDETSIPSGAFAPEGLHALPRERFEALKGLLAASPARAPGPDGGEEDAPEAALSISWRRGIGEVVKLRNHVGVVAFADGAQIEVLPKLLRSFGAPGSEARRENEARMRAVLLRMLREAWDLDAKTLPEAGLRTDRRLPLFEVFLRTYLDLAADVARCGLPGGYARVEENGAVFRGRLLVAPHVRENAARRDRFFVARDEFRRDVPANRLLRAAADFALARTSREDTRLLARRLLALHFEDVPPPANLAADLAACASAPPRDAPLRRALFWARLLLRGDSFANLSGDRRARALLFPMDRLFERYVARLVRRRAPDGLRVTAQDRSRHLFEESPAGKAFPLRPDIVLRRAGGGAGGAVVADTKWKLLGDDPARAYGVSQADAYQLFAYARRHEAQTALLVYPKHDALGALASHPPFFRTPGEAPLRVLFFDLASPESALQSASALVSFLDNPAP